MVISTDEGADLLASVLSGRHPGYDPFERLDLEALPGDDASPENIKALVNKAKQQIEAQAKRVKLA